MPPSTTPAPDPAPARGPDPEARGVPLVAVLLVLTAVSGLLDAVSFLGLGRVFTANMTGNVVILGFAAAGAPGCSAGHTATSLAGFLLGAAASGRVAAWHRTESRRARARLTLALEAVLTGGAAALAFARPDATGPGSGTGYALIALTAFAMGLRSAAVRRLGVADLNTTVLTMTLPGLCSESRLGDATSRRSPRRAGAGLAMLAGACLGAWLVLHHGPALPLLVAAATAAVLAVVTSGRE
jgi:uncharacterized membrane protein YoaK (UPF0700 family)